MKRLQKLIAVAVSAMMMAAGPVAAQDEESDFDNSLTYAGPDAGVGLDWVPQGLNFTIPLTEPAPPNTVVEVGVLSAEAKMIMMQGAMAGNPMSLRQMISMLVAKKKVAEDISACDRPYGDLPPSNIASYPFQPKKKDLRKIRKQLDIPVAVE